MSLMSWLFPSKKNSKTGAHRKSGRDHAGAGNGATKRKGERAARRELLYAVVREAMVRAGVLSASYKFKVLSLDGDGHQFLVMVDLARGAGGDAESLGEIEALIAQSAKSRHDIVVTGVYWRVNEHAAVDRADVRRHARAADSHPPPDSQPAPLHSAPVPLPPPSARGPAYEPIQADEVEAFKKALVEGSRPAPLAADKSHHGPRSYTLLTGYEDTEMPESDQKAPVLSGTQYGELR